MLDYGITRDIRSHGNILHKPQICNAVLKRIIGREISLTDLTCHASSDFTGPCHSTLGKQVESQNCQWTYEGVTTQVDCERDAIGKKCGGVEKNEAFDFFGMPYGIAHSDGPAPIVYHQRNIIEVQVINQFFQIIDVLRECVIIILRFIGQSASHMVRYQAPELTSQPFDQVTVINRPGRIAVEHKQGLSLPFVEVMQAVGVQFDEPRLEGIQITKRFQ